MCLIKFLQKKLRYVFVSFSLIEEIHLSVIKSPIDPIFIKELEILKLHDIYKYCTLKFVYKSVHMINPTQFHTYYIYPAHSGNTTTIINNMLDPPMVRTTQYGLKSLRHSGLWNDLPLDHRNVKSAKTFSNKLKKCLISKYGN